MGATVPAETLAPAVNSSVNRDVTAEKAVRGRSLRFRHQLPVSSPVALGALLRTALGQGLSEARTRLESLLTHEYAADRAVLCASGTEALQLAITTAWQRAGGTGSVALPAFACYDVASAAVGAGVPVDFFDLEPATLAPDLQSLEQVLRAGASVVVIAPLYGIPVDWDRIAKLCDQAGAIAIEDAAQGHGARWRGLPLGSHAALSVLSFGRGKGWTGGGGGALLMRGDLCSHVEEPLLAPATTGDDAGVVARLAAQWAIGRPTVYGLAAGLPHLRLGQTVYHDPVSPREMPRAAAALALQQRSLAAEDVGHRQQSGRNWSQELAEVMGITTVPVPEEGIPGYLRFPLLARRGMVGFADPGAASRAGIAASYPRPLPHLRQIQGQAGPPKRTWTGAELLSRTLITIPTHRQVSQRDRERVMEIFASYSTEGRQP